MSDARHSIQDLNPYNRFTHILQQEYVRSLTPSAYRELLDGDFAILQVLEPEIKAIIPKLDIENLRELIKSPKCILLLIVYYDFWIVQYKKDEHLDIQWRQSRNRAKYLAIMMVISDHAFWLADYILKRYPWHLDKRVRGENVSPEDRQLTDRVLADMIFSMAVDENAIESQRLDCQYWKRVEPDMLSWDIEDDSKQRFLFSIFEREHHLGTIESFVDMLDAYPINHIFCLFHSVEAFRGLVDRTNTPTAYEIAFRRDLIYTVVLLQRLRQEFGESQKFADDAHDGLFIVLGFCCSVIFLVMLVKAIVDLHDGVLVAIGISCSAIFFVFSGLALVLLGVRRYQRFF